MHEIQNNYDHNKHNNSENVQWKKKKRQGETQITLYYFDFHSPFQSNVFF